MQINGWKLYNHAAVPTTAPHESVNMEPLENGSIWKVGGIPLLARWHSEWDCGYETNWWYCIKDTPFDIFALKSKRRYEINKGNKNFRVQKISADEYVDDLHRVAINAYSEWPEKYRPRVDKELFIKQINSWNNSDIFGGFDRTTDALTGFAVVTDYSSYAEFSVLRTEPGAESRAINAAMVAGILDYYKDRFDGCFYINDGSRTIRHETAFQDYLEKYFYFRKAYCRLNVKYRRGVGMLIKLLYPFRYRINIGSKMGSNLSGILKMEEICRSF